MSTEQIAAEFRKTTQNFEKASSDLCAAARMLSTEQVDNGEVADVGRWMRCIVKEMHSMMVRLQRVHHDGHGHDHPTPAAHA